MHLAGRGSSSGSCRPVPARGAGRAGRAAALVVQAAKKAGGTKKSAQKKGGSKLAELLKKKEAAESEAAAAAVAAAAPADGFAHPAQYKDPDIVMQLLMICSSYKKQYGEFLMETGLDTLPDAMYTAPFVCLAHNKFEDGVTDPLFTYANRAALQLFEATWDELVGLPSRLSAAEDAQADRNAALEQAAEGGGIQSYSGWRVSRKGKRFRLRNVHLFNVAALSGEPWGQAAVVREYEEEDGTVVRVQGEGPPPSTIELPPSEEDVSAALALVKEQADAVRGLKEGEGLTNQHPRVQAAVAELQKRKSAAQEVQRKYEAALAEAAAEAAAPPTIEDDGSLEER